MIFKSIRIKIREILNPIIGPIRRDVLVNKGAILPFTIISNNCWGGHVYRFFAESYASPTIGMYFFTPDYIKLLNNLEYYFNLPLDFITYKESKYKNKLEEYGGDNLSCPIGKLDDIECIFLHYSTQQEAKDKWERRKKRINWDNLYVKMSEQNLCTEEHLKAFDLLPSLVSGKNL